MNIRVFEKRPGAWHLDFRLADGTRCRPFGGSSKAEAERRAPEVLAQAFSVKALSPTSATAPVSQGPTIEQSYRKALRVREQWITSKNKGSLQTTFDNLGVPASTPTSSLTRDRVRDLRASWLAEEGKRLGSKLSPSTINHRLSMLSVLLEVEDLPPHTVKHLSTRGNRRTRRISDDEVGEMLRWCAGNRARAGALALADLILLALDCAARQGELLALTWADVSGDTVTFRDTKNGESRTVPLTKRAEAILEARRALPVPFPGLTSDRIKDLWQDMRFAMGLATDEEFVFHSLRHEWASRAADRKESPFVMQAILGHSNITTTQVYVSASLEAMRGAVNRSST